MNPSVKEDHAQILCDYGLSYLQSASISDKNSDNSLKEKEIFIKAADFIQQGLEINPNNGQCHSLSAVILFSQEKYFDSWQEVKKAQQVGFNGTPQEFINELSSKMPDPGN